MTSSHSGSFSAAQLVGLPSSGSPPTAAMSVQQFLPARAAVGAGMNGNNSAEAAMAAAAAMGRQHSPLPTPPMPLPNWAYGHPALIPVDPQTESLAENWRQFQQAAYNYNLDPHILAMYGGAGFGHPHHHPHHHPRAGDLSARRKNATRETTSILKAWLNEHKKNPYPTKGEKIMLAIITTMTLTQVSTWFANARRRLKKENKMTWVPRNRAEEDEDDEFDAAGGGAAAAASANDDPDDPEDALDDIDVESAESPPPPPPPPPPTQATTKIASQQLLQDHHRKRPHADVNSADPHEGCQQHEAVARSKPRIWSIVDTLNNKTEPPPPQPRPTLQPPPLLQLPQPPPHPAAAMPPHHHHQHHPIPLGFFPHHHQQPPPPPPLLMPHAQLYYSLISAFNRPPTMAPSFPLAPRLEDCPSKSELLQ